MARRKHRFPRLSPEQAHAALRWLHTIGKVRRSDIVGALKRRDRLVAEIKKRLKQLGGERLRFLRGPEALKRPARRKAKRVSAKARAAWRAQGKYLGAVRRLAAGDRAKVKAIREKSGVRAAIAEAKKLAPKH